MEQQSRDLEDSEPGTTRAGPAMAEEPTHNARPGDEVERSGATAGAGSRDEIEEPNWSDVPDTTSPEELRMPSPSPSEQGQDDSARRIYVLGVGAVGTFIAHSLRGIANSPPITLLLHSRRNVYIFEEKSRSLTVTTHGRTERLTGFDSEQIRDRRVEWRGEDTTQEPEPEDAAIQYYSESPQEAPIRQLVVTTKTLHTLKAMQSIAHRLTPDSTICFLQNGMGVIDQINAQIFPDPSHRPRYLVGIVSHGLYQRSAFEVEHRGHGTIALSIQNPSLDSSSGSFDISSWAMSSRYLMRTLTRTTQLCALGVHPVDLLVLQLEKLAANCVINPLTTVYNCSNGDLGMNPGFRAVMRLIIAEVSLVYRKMPELKPLGQEKVERLFSPKRLEFLVQKIMKTTAPNMSSMWQDVFGARAEGRMTEVDYMNGYIVRRGDEVGVKCIINYMLTQQVEAQRVLQQRKRAGLEPFEKFTQLEPDVKEAIADVGDVRKLAEPPERDTFG